MDELIDDVTPYTLVAKPRLRRLGEQVWWLAVDKHVEGAFVECGVWRGGASFLMARVLQEAGISDRRVWLLDSFEGMSPPQELDGERVLRRWADQDSAVNFQRLAVAEADVRDTARRLGVDAICEIRRVVSTPPLGGENHDLDDPDQTDRYAPRQEALHVVGPTVMPLGARAPGSGVSCRARRARCRVEFGRARLQRTRSTRTT
jgi:hypothetical protein